jgi:hypothetical protein
VPAFAVEFLIFVTEEEAAAIYARACRSWYGIKADSVVNSQIRALMARGDRKGVAAWRRVAGALKPLPDDLMGAG